MEFDTSIVSLPPFSALGHTYSYSTLLPPLPLSPNTHFSPSLSLRTSPPPLLSNSLYRPRSLSITSYLFLTPLPSLSFPSELLFSFKLTSEIHPLFFFFLPKRTTSKTLFPLLLSLYVLSRSILVSFFRLFLLRSFTLFNCLPPLKQR